MPIQFSHERTRVGYFQRQPLMRPHIGHLWKDARERAHCGFVDCHLPFGILVMQTHSARKQDMNAPGRASAVPSASEAFEHCASAWADHRRASFPMSRISRKVLSTNRVGIGNAAMRAASRKKSCPSGANARTLRSRVVAMLFS